MTRQTRYRRFLIVGVVFFLSVASQSPLHAVTETDSFDTFFDYSGFRGGTPGTVPAGGIWDGIHNPINGGDGTSIIPVLEANGSDFGGTPKPGVLLIEDLAEFPQTDLTNGIGWDQIRSSAPLLYVEVPSGGDFEATAQITAQTAGPFSTAGIVARVANPAGVGTTRGDGFLSDGTKQSPYDAGIHTRHHPDENFITAYRFKQDDSNPDTNTLLTKHIQNGAAVLDTQANLSGTVPDNAPFIRLVKVGDVLSTFFSEDGTTWNLATFTQAPELNDPAATLQVGLAFGLTTNTLEFGEAEFESFSIRYDETIASGPFTWSTDASSAYQDGLWLSTGGVPSGAPNSNTAEVILGDAITSNTTVFTNTAVTVKSATIDNANSYVLAGAGSMTLEADSGDAGLTVSQGGHTFQLPVSLSSNMASSIAAGARADLDNALSLNGNTLTNSGDGDLFINNDTSSGAAGAVVNNGRLGGVGTINGDLTQASTGTFVVEINDAAWTGMTVDGDLILDGNIDVSLLDGYEPTVGETFAVLMGDSLTLNGSLSLVGAAAASFTLSTTSTSVILTGATSGVLQGDYNNDGVVDAADYAVFRDNLPDGELFFNETASPGVVDQADYIAWRENYGAVLTPVAESVAAPEPVAAWVVALFGAVALCNRRSLMLKPVAGVALAVCLFAVAGPQNAMAQPVALSDVMYNGGAVANPSLFTGDTMTGTMTNGLAETIDFQIDNVTIGGDDTNFNDLTFLGGTFEYNWFSRDTASGTDEVYSYDLAVTSGQSPSFLFADGTAAGNNNNSQFTIDWGDTGAATVIDPNTELEIISNDNGAITFHLLEEIAFRPNPTTQWQILTPAASSLSISYLETPDDIGTQQERFSIDGFFLTPPSFDDFEWGIDDSGDWGNGLNWTADAGGLPNNNMANALFGDVISGDQTVFSNEEVTAKTVTFDNVNEYAIAGAGSLTMEADSGAAMIDVLQGSHQIQLPLLLSSDLEIDAALGSVLDVNGAVDLNGFSLTVSGDGTVNFNNGVTFGGGSLSESVSAAGLVTLEGAVFTSAPEPAGIALLLACITTLGTRGARES